MTINGDEVVQVDDLQLLSNRIYELSNLVLYAGIKQTIYESSYIPKPSNYVGGMIFGTTASKDEYETVVVERTWNGTFGKSEFEYKDGESDDGVIKLTVDEGTPNTIYVGMSKNTHYIDIYRVYLKPSGGGQLVTEFLKAVMK